MLIGIISDLHANLEATLAVLGKLEAIAPDQIVCLGDVAGYNANPNEVIDLLREREIPTLMGNHDAAASGLEEPWFFNERARAAIAWQCDRLRDDNRRWLKSLPEQIPFGESFLAVHGSPGSRDQYIMDWLDAIGQLEFLDNTPVRACFFGHSHLAGLFAEKGTRPSAESMTRYTLAAQNRYLINPGSVGQPRDGDPRAAFGLLEVQTMTFEFHRAEYNTLLAAQKIVDAGLPVILARRLDRGK